MSCSSRGSIRSLNLETFVQERYRLPGGESLLPPLVAIALAFAFRNTLLCLLAGIWVGATAIVGGNPLVGLFWVGYEGILRHALLDRFRLEILVFIFGLVGTVGIMSRMGGVAGMLAAAGRAVRGVRSHAALHLGDGPAHLLRRLRQYHPGRARRCAPSPTAGA